MGTNGKESCTGSLINAKFVLTAASCFCDEYTEVLRYDEECQDPKYEREPRRYEAKVKIQSHSFGTSD